MYYELFQAEKVRYAAWSCDWVGTPVSFQRCLVFIITAANKGYTLTAGKFVPVCNKTMMNVRILIVPSTTMQLHLSHTVPRTPHKAQPTLQTPNAATSKCYFALQTDTMNTLHITRITTGTSEYSPDYWTCFFRKYGSKYHKTVTVCIVQRVFLVTEY
jgi:hypothetical protein